MPFGVVLKPKKKKTLIYVISHAAYIQYVNWCYPPQNISLVKFIIKVPLCSLFCQSTILFLILTTLTLLNWFASFHLKNRWKAWKKPFRLALQSGCYGATSGSLWQLAKFASWLRQRDIATHLCRVLMAVFGGISYQYVPYIKRTK